MLAIAGQTAKTNWLIFFEETYLHPRGDRVDSSVFFLKFQGQRRAFRIVIYIYVYSLNLKPESIHLYINFLQLNTFTKNRMQARNHNQKSPE